MGGGASKEPAPQPQEAPKKPATPQQQQPGSPSGGKPVPPATGSPQSFQRASSTMKSGTQNKGFQDTLEDDEAGGGGGRKPGLHLTQSNLSSTRANLGRRTAANRETAFGIETMHAKPPPSASPQQQGLSPSASPAPDASLGDTLGGELNRTTSKASTAFSSAKARARNAEKQAQLQVDPSGGSGQLTRKYSGLGDGLGDRTASNLEQALLMQTASQARPEAPKHIVNGTAKIKHLVEALNKFRLQMRKHREVSDSDIQEMRRTQEQYAQLKLGMAQQIAALGSDVDVVGKVNRHSLYDMLAGIMQEGEVREGSLQLIRTCINHLTVLEWQKDFACGRERKMIYNCAKDGHFQFLDALLQIPYLIVRTQEEHERIRELQLAAKNRELKKNKKGGADSDDSDDFLADVDEDADVRPLDLAQPIDSVGDFVTTDRSAGGGEEEDEDDENFLDPVALLKICLDNKSSRLLLCGTLCRHWGRLRFVEYTRAMLPLWKDLVHCLCSTTLSLKGEDRTTRLGLLSKILSLNSCIPINVSQIEDDIDSQSLISRSIIEGETAVFQTLTKRSDNVDWACVLPDGHSLLTLACACSQRMIVELLIAQPLVDVQYEAPGQGTALDIVRMNGGNQQLTALIENRINQIENERMAAEKEKMEDEQKNRHQELRRRLQQQKRARGKASARELNPPAWVEGRQPTGPIGIDVDKDPDWIYDKDSRPIVCTGPVLDIVNTMREHWHLVEVGSRLVDENDENSKEQQQQQQQQPPPSASADGEDALDDIGEERGGEDDEQQQQQQQQPKSDEETKEGNNNQDDNEGVDATSNNKKGGGDSGENDTKDNDGTDDEKKKNENNNNNDNDGKPDADADDKNVVSRSEKKLAGQVIGDVSENGDITISAATIITEEIIVNREEEPQQRKPTPPTQQAEFERLQVLQSDDEEYLSNAEAVRSDCINALLSLGTRLIVEGKNPKEKVYQTVSKLLAEGSGVPGSLKLARLLLFRVVTVDFAPSIAGSTKWALKAAQRGDMEALESVLRVDKLWREEHEVVELVMSCIRARGEMKIRLSLLLMRHVKQLRFGTYRDHLRPLWEELVENITNPTRTVQMRMTEEDQRMRHELFCRIFATPNFFQLRHDIEITQGMTWFSRACRIGDIAFVQACIDYCVCDINKVYSNKSTPLMQAIVGNQLEIVKLLCNCSDIDPLVEGANGMTALDLANSMKRDHELIDVIVRTCEELSGMNQEEQQQQQQQDEDHTKQSSKSPSQSPSPGRGLVPRPPRSPQSITL